jgi:mono/diheme cytochrome c family protein
MAEPALAVLGLFETPGALLEAVGRLRPGPWELKAYTPYPVHGLDAALGLKPSPLGGMVLVMGILGALAALGGQYWISAVDYPLLTGGKPPGSWEAFVPIMFEVTVLFATFTAGLGMLVLLNGLPFYGHPLLTSRAIGSITRDRFALALFQPAGLPLPGGLDLETACAALEAAGARDLEALAAPPAEPAFTSAFLLRALGGLAFACALAGVATYGAVKFMPVLAPMARMERQPRLDAQQPSAFFTDGRGMRMPVEGTVARGYLPTATGTQNEAAALVNPLPRVPAVFAQGRRAFMERCAVCHGALADGHGSLTAAFGGKPANLQAAAFRAYPDGKIYWVIVNGKNAMPAQGADLTTDECWAVVHYLRALQRAQNALDSDLPAGTR